MTIVGSSKNCNTLVIIFDFNSNKPKIKKKGSHQSSVPRINLVFQCRYFSTYLSPGVIRLFSYWNIFICAVNATII